MAPVLSRPLRLACPCIGWDAPGHAFRRLGQPVEILYAYDTDVRVYKPLVALHGRAVVDRFCLGPYVGDICAVDYSNWECVDAIIAGPPCPPVSRIGLRFANEDPRQRVWDRCVDIIIDQGRKGAYFFVLEMVLGVTDRPRGGGESVATTFRRRLQTEAPMWAVVMGVAHEFLGLRAAAQGTSLFLSVLMLQASTIIVQDLCPRLSQTHVPAAR